MERTSNDGAAQLSGLCPQQCLVCAQFGLDSILTARGASGDSSKEGSTLILPMMGHGSGVPPARWSNVRARIEEGGLATENGEPGAALRKERGAHGRSPWAPGVSIVRYVL